MKRIAYLLGGYAAVALGVIGMFLPLLPTVPFLILAAFCFARSSPAFEQRLLDHPNFGPHIRQWRERGAISRTGKYGATGAFAISAIGGLFFLEWPWVLIPIAVAVIGSSWMWTRPDA